MLRKVVRLLGACLLAASTLCIASEPMYESHYPYRDNDVFLFCKDGLKKPRAWGPDDPIHSQWHPEGGHCPIPHNGGTCPLCDHSDGIHFGHWTTDEYQAWEKWMRICPFGDEEGSWDGENGRPENVPKQH